MLGSPTDPWNNEGVKKKRRAWWIVGGVVCIVVLALATAMLIKTNSPDARLERAIRQIIAEQGFEHSTESQSIDVGEGNDRLIDVYRGKVLSQEKRRRIIDQLDQACPSCSTKAFAFGDEGLSVTPLGEEHTFFIHYWINNEGSAIDSVTITVQAASFRADGESPSSRLTILHSEPNRWSFLKNLWPW